MNVDQQDCGLGDTMAYLHARRAELEELLTYAAPLPLWRDKQRYQEELAEIEAALAAIEPPRVWTGYEGMFPTEGERR